MKAKITATILLLCAGVLNKCSQSGGEQVGLPLIQISHGDDLNDDYPEMKEEVHLEDFFWTGSGDGPPDYLKKVHTGISKGKDVIVKTETVVATVYVDGNNEIEIPICLDCKPDDGGGHWDVSNAGLPPLNYSATDRRYWLLTVMSGFYSPKDNPMLEEKLARLYRLAFTRQQSRHLDGLNGAQQIDGVSVSAPRERRRPFYATSTTVTVPTIDTQPSDDVEILDMNADGTHYIKSVLADGGRTEWSSSSEESAPADATVSSTATSMDMEATMHTTTGEPSTIDYGAIVTLIPWELIQKNGKSEKLQEMREALLTQQQQQASEGEWQPVLQPLRPLFREERVRVVIHNITQITEADVQKWNASGAVDEEDYVNLKFNERPIANQTELIYTVLVNERPVLASTAAKDMELVTEAEAVSAMGQAIFMKSEPYIREPTATALAPVPRSGQAGFLNSFKDNAALVVISSLAILLLLLLLVAVLLLGRTRARQRELSAVNRTSSRNELLSESQSMRPSSRGTMLDSNVAGTAGGAGATMTSASRDVAVQNYAYEREPRISFPPAPPHDTHSQHDSMSSTDNTSDSSVYCPINPPNADVQRILDDKAARLFDGHKRRHHQYDRAEGREDTIYTSVVSDKKSDKSRHKSKRRYLNENRVGSLETSPVQRPSTGHDLEPSSADEAISPRTLRRSYENFQRNETFNPHNNYHRNKLLQQQQNIFSDKDYEEGGGSPHSTQAINKEIMRGLHPSERSSDTASVGSFLSMNSVRAFPKNTLPEPLNRVLDPVFVTYYDNVDNLGPKTTSATGQNSARSQKSHKSHGSSTIATISSFPSPKAPPVKTVRAASHSDNPDPGVVGPIVWERHKKRMSRANDAKEALSYADYSPVHDPSAIRSHYEGLLEGAMQMYSSQDDLPMPLPTRDFTNSRRATKREYRGSSAGLPSYTSKAYSTTERPATAQPEKTPKSAQSTQPPSPTYSAWAGSSMHGSHSPLVRPLSAGPFQQLQPECLMELPNANRRRQSQASAAPLIEAIQSELRKFKQEQQK